MARRFAFRVVAFAGMCVLLTLGLLPLSARGRKENAPRRRSRTIGMKLARIPAGKFTHGVAGGRGGPTEDEGPEHEVRSRRRSTWACTR